MRYALMLFSDEPKPGEISEETMATYQAAFSRYVQSLEAAGVLISAEVLQPSATATTVRMRDGRLQVQDGPFAATREQLGGTFVIDVPHLDAALAWAERCPGAQYGVVEVRPSAVYVREGRWQASA